MADEEVVQGEGDDETVEAPKVEEAAPAAYGGAEFVPETSSKPKSDVFTMLLIFGFVAFLTGCIFAGNELFEFYDVKFWILSKK